MAEVTFNDISQELRDKLPKLKPGENIQFRIKQSSTIRKINDDETAEIMPVQPHTQNVPSQCRIWDPWKNGDGDYVELAYITGYSPVDRDGRKGMLPNFGTIEFRASFNGHITVEPKNKALFEYMCLCNYNENSVNPGVEKPETGFIFEQIMQAEDAKAKRERTRSIQEAMAVIEEANKQELEIMREALGVPKADAKGAPLTEDEIVVMLQDIASKNPKRVMNASREESGRLLAIIREAQNKNLIEVNEEDLQWQYSDNKQKIVGIKPGSDYEQALLSYFQNNTSAEAVIYRLKKQIEAPARKPKFNKAAQPVSAEEV